MSFDKIFDLTAGVYFYFVILYYIICMIGMIYGLYDPCGLDYLDDLCELYDLDRHRSEEWKNGKKNQRFQHQPREAALAAEV